MNHTTTHARWRVLPVHMVAKLFGVLIKVEGMPFGSNRTHLANAPRREDLVGGQVGNAASACTTGGTLPSRDRDTLLMLLAQVIANAAPGCLGDIDTVATDAVKAFKAGMNAYDSISPDL